MQLAGQRYFSKSLDGVVELFKSFDVISFDLVDTLICMAYMKPEDLHQLVSFYVTDIVGSNKFNHVEFRLNSEKLTRTETLEEEVTLREIYQKYLMLTGLPGHKVEEIKQLEMRLLEKFVQPRQSGIWLYEQARLLNKKVVITSDWFYSKEFVIRLLSKIGFEITAENLYLSSDIKRSKKIGGLYEYLAKSLGVSPAKILHIGDNFAVDIKSALAQGVSCLHFPSVLEVQKNSTASFNLLNHPLVNGIYSSPTIEQSIVFALIAQRRFSDPFAINKVREFPNGGVYDIGYSFLGPVILGFTQWLVKKLEEDSVEKVAFLSRDGHLLKRAYESFVRNTKVNLIPPLYLLGSRRFFNIACLSDDFSTIQEIVRTRIQTGTLKYLLNKRFNLEYDDSTIPEGVLAKGGFMSLDSEVSLPRDAIRVLKVLCALKESILSEARNFKEGYLKYLSSINIHSGERIALVDVGYFGSLQKALMTIKPDNDWRGYYFATRREIEFEKSLKNKNDAYFAKNIDLKDRNLRSLATKLAYFEFLLSAPHGSFEGFNKDGSYKYVDAQIEKEQWHALKLLHQGAVDFIEKLTQILGDDIQRYDFSKIAFDQYLAIMLNREVKDFNSLMCNFKLENTYSNEVLSFDASIRFPINFSERQVQEKKLDTVKALNEGEKKLEPSKQQRFLLNAYSPILKIILKNKPQSYQLYRSDPFLFLARSNSSMNHKLVDILNLCGEFKFIRKDK